MKKTGNKLFRILRLFFGLFMIFVYVGMAALMYFNFFDWSASLTWFRYILAVVFLLYGVYRGYRQVTGVDYYWLTDKDDKDQEQ